MAKDAYEREWQAQRGTWRALLWNQANTESEAAWRQRRYEGWVRTMGEKWARQELAREQEQHARALRKRLEQRERDRKLWPLLESMDPVNEWVGAAWVDTEGNLYPVRYGNHTNRAEGLAPYHFQAEIAGLRARQGYADCGAFLSDKGWLRIGTDGLVGDHTWTRVQEMTQAQLDAIAAMYTRGNECGTSDYHETRGFLHGLRTSVRYARGEVNQWGETPEEVQARHARDAEYRAFWAARDAERKAAQERAAAERRSRAAKRGWATRRRRAAVAV